MMNNTKLKNIFWGKKVLGFCGGSGGQVFILLDQTEVSVTNDFYSL